MINANRLLQELEQERCIMEYKFKQIRADRIILPEDEGWYYLDGQARRHACLGMLEVSIKDKGIINPVTVFKIKKPWWKLLWPTYYRIVEGELRVEAARNVGINWIPAIVRGPMTKEQILEYNLLKSK